MKNYYQSLGVDWKAKTSDIKLAYQIIQAQSTPNRSGNTPLSTIQLEEIKEAYTILMDEEARKKYNVDYFLYFIKGEREQPLEKQGDPTLSALSPAHQNGIGAIDGLRPKAKSNSNKSRAQWLALPLLLLVGLAVFASISQLVPEGNFASKDHFSNDTQEKSFQSPTKNDSKHSKSKIEPGIVKKENSQGLLATNSVQTTDEKKRLEKPLQKTKISAVNRDFLETKDLTPPKNLNENSFNSNKSQKGITQSNLKETKASSNPTKKGQAVPTSTLTPSRKKLRTGESPYTKYFGQPIFKSGSKNQLRLNNQDQLDAVVCLVDLYTHQIIRHQFVKAGRNFTMDKIPNGTYFIQVYLGKNWNPDKKVLDGGIIGGFESGESVEVYNSEHQWFKMKQDTMGRTINSTQYEVKLGKSHKVYANQKKTSLIHFFSK